MLRVRRAPRSVSNALRMASSNRSNLLNMGRCKEAVELRSATARAVLIFLRPLPLHVPVRLLALSIVVTKIKVVSKARDLPVGVLSPAEN